MPSWGPHDGACARASTGAQPMLSSREGIEATLACIVHLNRALKSCNRRPGLLLPCQHASCACKGKPMRSDMGSWDGACLDGCTKQQGEDTPVFNFTMHQLPLRLPF